MLALVVFSPPLVFSDSLLEVLTLATVLSGVAMLYRRHNCHIRGCWRLQWKLVAGTDHVVCRHHHPADAPTHQQVLEDRKAARRAAIRRS